MKNYILLITVSFIVFSGCKQKQLPYLGFPETEEVKEGNTTRIDTISYYRVPDFMFVNQNGDSIGSAFYKNKIYLANFFFTTCTQVCPKMNMNMANIYELYKNSDKVAFASFSIDPEMDKVAILHEYAKAIEVSTSNWNFLTGGTKKEMLALGNDGYLITAVEDAQGERGVDHKGAIALIDKEGHIRGIYDGTDPKKIDEIVLDIEVLLDE